MTAINYNKRDNYRRSNNLNFVCGRFFYDNYFNQECQDYDERDQYDEKDDNDYVEDCVC